MSVDKEFEEDLIEGVLAEARVVGSKAKKKAVAKKVVAKKKAVAKKVVTKEPPLPAPAEQLAPPSPKKHGRIEKAIIAIERKFLTVVGLEGDLSIWPVSQDSHLQVLTTKDKSDEHGQVFTPLYLVDQMVERLSDHELRQPNIITEDLCAGYGQFSIRIIRKKYSLLGENFNIKRFLGETHLFIEIQPNSCFRLMSIFGTGIRLLMGDAAKKGMLPDSAEKGIWLWSDVCEKWYDITDRAKRWHAEALSSEQGWDKRAALFEKRVEAMRARVEARKKGKKDGKER